MGREDANERTPNVVETNVVETNVVENRGEGTADILAAPLGRYHHKGSHRAEGVATCPGEISRHNATARNIDAPRPAVFKRSTPRRDVP